MRPSLHEIDARADAMLQPKGKTGRPSPPAAALAGDLVCVLDLQRSRLTVSSTADISIGWRADGCADGRSQFANGADGWFRVFVPSDDETVTVSSFDPASGVYKAERYLLDYDAMTRLRAERDKMTSPQCGAAPQVAQQMSSGQLALKALLPASPNERLVYNCSKARSAE
jgi:hypothetical protein